MSGRLVRCVAAAVLAASCLCSLDGGAAVSGRERELARKHANAGYESFSAGDYATALAHFKDAEDTVHAPPHLLFMARALDKLGRLLEARDTYRRLVDERLPRGTPAAFRDAQKTAQQELLGVEGRIPKLKLLVEGAPLAAARVSLDGQAVAAERLGEPIALDPGKHQARAEADGMTAAEQLLDLQAGAGTLEVKLVLVKVAPPPPPPPPPEDTTLSAPGFVLLGLGVAGLAAGAITGGLALGRASELRDRCPANPCPTEYQSLSDKANTLATVSTVSFAVGGAAAAAGVVWLLAEAAGGAANGGNMEGGEAPTGTSARWTLVPRVGAGSIALSGTF
jgi:hypothetical protein